MQPSRVLFGLLGMAHVAIAIVLLPSAMFLGFLSLLVLTPALVWLAALGVWLWWPSRRLRTLLRYTHRILAPFSILLIAYGLFALGEGQRSAEAGGGLLGGFGLVPIVMGLLAGSLSMVSFYALGSAAFENISAVKKEAAGDVEERTL